MLGIIPQLRSEQAAHSTLACGERSRTAQGTRLKIKTPELGVFFISKKQRTLFGTNNYQFRFPETLQMLKVGFPRSIAKGVIFSAWLATVHQH